MTALPAKGDLDGTTGGHNQGMFKTAIGNLRDYLAGLFGTGGTPATALDALKLLDVAAVYNLSIGFSVGSNALTATVKDSKGADLSASNPGFVMQRHATLSSGLQNLRAITGNISTVISSGSTAGHASGVEGYLHWYLIDNGGTQELAWSTKDFGESGRVSTTAEGGAGAADSATVMYSTTARSNVPFRKIATTKDTQTTAGSWTAIPTTVQPGAKSLIVEENAWAEQQYHPIAILTDGASIAWDLRTQPVAKVTLGGNRTMNAPTNMREGATYTLRVIQDGTGSRTISWNSVFKWEGGAAPTLSTAASSQDVLSFYCDGTNMIGAVFARGAS